MMPVCQRPQVVIVSPGTNTSLAFGGTLSSYTWICMIVNFLQCRNPPVLPSLHQRPHLKMPCRDGHQSEFADDLGALRGAGKDNKETLGDLLFQFFRYYGHEIDYRSDKVVVSVRDGKLISKHQKGWHLQVNNRLCVEEPFNVNRNLGNTADDTSFRGLHLELRRAFDLISKGSLAECCEQYIFPKEEERIWERRVQQPPPRLTRSTSQTTRGRGGQRGARHASQPRNQSHNNRRSSGGAFDSNGSTNSAHTYAQSIAANEAWLKAQQAQQTQLHNELYNSFQVLQAQENNLRLQLYSQSQAYAQAFASAQRQQGNGTGLQQPRDGNSTRSDAHDQPPPMSAPLRPDLYFYPLQYTTGQPLQYANASNHMYGQSNPGTYPPSPAISTTQPELRRSIHRSSITGASGMAMSSSSLRSHSQPASRSAPSPLALNSYPNTSNGLSGLAGYQHFVQPIGLGVPNFAGDENVNVPFDTDPRLMINSPPEGEISKEYVGYYVDASPPSPAPLHSVQPMPIPAYGDPAQPRRRPSTDHFPQAVFDRIRRTSRSPSPHGDHRSYVPGAQSAPLTAIPFPSQSAGGNPRMMHPQGPMVVNGSNGNHLTQTRSHENASAEWQFIQQDHGYQSSATAFNRVDLPEATTDRGLLSQQYLQATQQEALQHRSRQPAPPIVNGSSAMMQKFNGLAISTSSLPDAVNASPSTPIKGLMPLESGTATKRLSPHTRQRLNAQTQTGGMSPLDLCVRQSEPGIGDAPHLSPVYEAHSPSPVAVRRKDSLKESKVNGVHKAPKATKHETPSTSTKPALAQIETQIAKPSASHSAANGMPKQSGSANVKTNGHMRNAKSEGSALNSWTKISSNKRKGLAAEMKNGINPVPTHSERLPAAVSERKGG